MSKMRIAAAAPRLAASLALGLCLYSGSPALAAQSAVAALDKDADASLDLAEVKAAAGVMFDKLNRDSDDTLEPKELGRRLGKQDFAAANPDDDGTLSKDEYAALATKLFEAADANKDGVLTEKELHSKAGRALVRLIQ